MSNLTKSNALLLVYFLLTLVIMVVGWNEVIHPSQLLVNRLIILLGLTIAFILLKSRENWFTQLLYSAFPVWVSGYFYQETFFYNKLIWNDLDPFLAGLETGIFGQQPSLVFSEHLPQLWFSEIMYASYFFFYVLVVGFVFYVFFKNRSSYGKAVFYLTATLYGYYLIFSVFPSVGPQYFYSSPENILPEAFFFDKIMIFIKESVEQPTGAFPSSHVGVSLAVMVLSRQLAPKFFKICLPIVILLIISTVYIKAHYVIDVLAAIIVLPLMQIAIKYLYGIIPGKQRI